MANEAVYNPIINEPVFPIFPTVRWRERTVRCRKGLPCADNDGNPAGKSYRLRTLPVENAYWQHPPAENG